MRICLIEAADPGQRGSIGTFYIAEAIRKAGYQIDILDGDKKRFGYDVELISIHHPSDYTRLKKLPKRGKVRIIGGHVTYNNPRPIIPLADYVCLGDGEEWIVQALQQIEKHHRIDLPGTIETENWKIGDKIPQRTFVKSLHNPAYLNRAHTLSAAWYLEIARGCPFHCSYCELGHSMPYRYADKDRIMKLMGTADRMQSKKIVWFAPDEASYPFYIELLSKAKSLGMKQLFGSYRIDRLLKDDFLDIDKPQLIRVGVDGMTESTRHKVKKPITNMMIIAFFNKLLASGHTQFKLFQMFAYPWEALSDFDEWEDVMERVFKIPHNETIILRIKWTPFIPQPITPLGKDEPQYHQKMAEKIRAWHQRIKNKNGWVVSCDGLMSKRTHLQHCTLVNGDELSLLHNTAWIHPKWRNV